MTTLLRPSTLPSIPAVQKDKEVSGGPALAGIVSGGGGGVSGGTPLIEVLSSETFEGSSSSPPEPPTDDEKVDNLVGGLDMLQIDSIQRSSFHHTT